MLYDEQEGRGKRNGGVRMDKIRCPHCGAVNQDVTPKDNCWQCGKPLSADPAPADTGGETSPTGPPLKQVSKPSLEERVAARKAARKQTNLTPYLIVALVLIIALILFLVMKH